MTDHLDYDSLRADTVRQVAKLMAAAAITAPKSGGQLFLAGKHLFIETVIVDDRETLTRLAAWMRARGKERREAIWFREGWTGSRRCLSCRCYCAIDGASLELGACQRSEQEAAAAARAGARGRRLDSQFARARCVLGGTTGAVRA